MSLKILVVDDDEMEYQCISFLIGKYLDRPTEVLYADSGLAALDILDRTPVHILFCDIKMPGMDGLQLCEELSERGCTMPIVIISAFGEFEYARRAMRLGVTNYLLKPLKAAEFKDVLAATVNAALAQQQTQKIDRLRRLLDRGEPIHSWEDGTSAAVLYFSQNSLDAQYHLCAAISRRLGTPVSLALDECRLLCIGTQPFEAWMDTLRTAVQDVSAMAGCPLYIVAGALPSIGDLPAFVEQAARMEDFRFFLDANTVIPVERFAQAAFDSAFDPVKLLVETPVTDKDELRALLVDIYARLRQDAHISAVYLRYLFAEMCKTLMERYALQNPGLFQQTLQRINKVDCFNDLCAIANHVVDALPVNLHPTAEDSRLRGAVRQVLDIIEREYMQDLSLEELAGRVYLSPSYLSQLFKVQTHKSLIKYLNDFRLAKAAELLTTTNRKITQICKDVGYQNVSYFGAIFKGKYGMTPLSYRETNYEEGR